MQGCVSGHVVMQCSTWIKHFSTQSGELLQGAEGGWEPFHRSDAQADKVGELRHEFRKLLDGVLVAVQQVKLRVGK